MTGDLHGTAIDAFWTGTSFLLSSAVFQPPLASLSHIFGRMHTLVFCTIMFLIGIIISSVAKDFTAMLVGRTIQGVGGGGVILLNDIVITDLVPMRKRGDYFGMIGGVWALGSVSGPVIGGALAYKATWVSNDRSRKAWKRTNLDSLSNGYSGSISRLPSSHWSCSLHSCV